MRQVVNAMVVSLLLCAATPAYGDTLLVPTDYPTIQAGLDASLDGDEVVVEPGTYFELLTVPAHGVVLRSQSNDPSNTILDGSVNGNATMVHFPGNPTATRAIRGFTLTAAEGHAVEIDDLATLGRHVIEHCRFVNNGPLTPVRAAGGFVEVLDNEFVDNDGDVRAGALLVRGAACILGNVFRGNEALPYGGEQFTNGGAVYLYEARPVGAFVEIRDNMFEGNYCNDYGGGIYVSEMFDVVVEGNTFLRNTADICAGAVYVDFNQRDVQIRGNLFVENTSEFGATLALGICNGTTVEENTIVGSLGGSGIDLDYSTDLTISRNIVAFGETVGIEWFGTSSGVQSCNDAFGNPGGDYVGMSPGSDNFSNDPLFCAVAEEDFSLRSDSPCLAPNNSCGVDIGSLPQGCSTVPVSITTWGRLKAKHLNDDKR